MFTFPTCPILHKHDFIVVVANSDHLSPTKVKMENIMINAVNMAATTLNREHTMCVYPIPTNGEVVALGRKCTCCIPSLKVNALMELGNLVTMQHDSLINIDWQQLEQQVLPKDFCFCCFFHFTKVVQQNGVSAQPGHGMTLVVRICCAHRRLFCILLMNCWDFDMTQYAKLQHILFIWPTPSNLSCTPSRFWNQIRWLQPMTRTFQHI